ncbi:hypothetical protein [Streptomyces rimosus]|uniref:hypothetical protein n=1 Tax=Streptomyces rimosus TaxID=1927 RepID=UPI0004C61493|nr:hypothetical protein [Streptomyces rimosus]
MTKAKRRHLVAAALTAVGAGGLALVPAAGAVPSTSADTRNVTARGGGWINNVFIRGGNNDEPVPGIPIC